MSEIKIMFNEAVTNPKVAAIIMFIANASNWASDNFDLILTRATGLASLILIIVMIRYHIKNTRKIDKEK